MFIIGISIANGDLNTNSLLHEQHMIREGKSPKAPEIHTVLSQEDPCNIPDRVSILGDKVPIFNPTDLLGTFLADRER